MGSLRAAAQVRGLSRKIGCDAAEGAANGKVEEVTRSVGPVFAPLEQCIAVLGIRGRFSLELSRAIRVSTKDDGHRLTTSTSIGLLTETVKNIMASVDTSRLTEAERRLSHCPSAGAKDDDEDVAAFMGLADILSRKAATEKEKRPNQSDEAHQARTECSDGENDEDDGAASA